MSTHLTIDQILEMVTGIAQDPEAGADRFRALKMLATTNAATVTIPPPMTQDELVSRLARLIHGSGLHIAQLAFHQAFPKTKSSAFDAPVMDTKDLTEKDRELCAKVKTLKMLYRRFPELKRPGFPPGYPVGKGLVAQQAWCQNSAVKAMIDRKQAEAVARSKEPISESIADSSPA